MDLSDSLPGVKSQAQYLRDLQSERAIQTFNQYHDPSGRYYPEGAPGSDIARRNREYNAAREAYQAQQNARKAASQLPFADPPNPNGSFYAAPRQTTGNRTLFPRSVNPTAGGVGNTVTAAKRLPNASFLSPSVKQAVRGVGAGVVRDAGMGAIAAAGAAAYHQYDQYKRSLSTEERRKVMLAESVANSILPTNVSAVGAGLAAREAVGRLLSGEAAKPQSEQIAGGEYGSTTQTVDGPVPFTGGQSVGVNYNVSFRVNWEFGPSTGTQTVTGPVTGSAIRTTVLPNENVSWTLVIFGGGQEYPVTGGTDRPNSKQTGGITNISRLDGQPDTGGNPLPTPIQQPVTTTRPIYKAGTSLPEASQALTPSPINLPGLSPSPLPNPTPSGTQAPQEEIPPSALPQNPAAPTVAPNPLIDGEGKPTGEPAPKASENNVPKSVIAAAIAGATLFAVGKLVGKATVSGQTVGGEAIKDPTTPGKFTTPNQPPPRPPSDTPTTNPCGCNTPVLNALGEIDRKLGAAGGLGGEAVSLAVIMNRLNQMQEFAEKAWKNTHLDKIVNLLTLISVLHNVSMLSRDVAETLGYAISNGLAAVGIKDEGGSPLNINEIVGKEVTELIVQVIGQDAYNDLRANYLKANRILSTGSQIIWSIRSIADTTTQLLEWVGEHTGKIGNALKRFGVVGERAYGWMSERPTAQATFRRRFDRIFDGLESAENTASSFATATSGVLEIQQEVTELQQQRQQFEQALQAVAPRTLPDNDPVKEAATTAATNAQSPVIAGTDTDRG